MSVSSGGRHAEACRAGDRQQTKRPKGVVDRERCVSASLINLTTQRTEELPSAASIVKSFVVRDQNQNHVGVGSLMWSSQRVDTSAGGRNER